MIIVAGLAIAAVGHADMTPISRGDADHWQSVAARETVPPVSRPLCPQHGLSIDDLAALRFTPLAAQDAGEATRPVMKTQILVDKQDSRSLCLYALLGLGLCKSPCWLKKASLGGVPTWYHDGGPLQVGHSHAVSPDCLCHALVYCLVQPDCATMGRMLPHRQQPVVVFWRASQFTPAVLASRGPPRIS
jgi:hypothetical protein